MTGINSIEILKKNRNMIISNFLDGNEHDLLQKNSGFLDKYFCDGFLNSKVGPVMQINKRPYAIVALGGYGREEQCIFSDVDLLLLFGKKVPGEALELVQEIIYPLWDIGLEVGYATRSVKESVALAREDVEVFTSLLDARFICGFSNLFTDLKESIRKNVVNSHKKKMIKKLVERNRSRHESFGDSSYLLEPNLKEGLGGLRDYHTMVWTARILTNLKQPRDLEYEGYLSYAEFQELTNALDFIWNVRNKLHCLTKRKCDQLYFEHQFKIAEAENSIKDTFDNSVVEEFLGNLHEQMDFIKHTYHMFLAELGFVKGYAIRKRILKKQTKIKGLSIVKGLFNFNSIESILHSPELMIRIFEESAKFKLPLSAETKRLIKEFAYLVDHDFRSSPLNIRTFENILLSYAPEFNVLSEMLSTGFLTHMIPEFRGIVHRIQFDRYHLYPVDIHLIRTVHVIKRIASNDCEYKNELFARLCKEIKSKISLLWAALLHDIGKDLGENHSERGAVIVESVLNRADYNSSMVADVCFLVREHLFLIKIATRRDINSEETILFCARKIKDIERLKMLYVLSIADSIATGPKAWNQWTNALLKELFLKVLKVLETGELVTVEAVKTIEEKTSKIIKSFDNTQESKEIQSFLKSMPSRYLLYTPYEVILEHVFLYKDMADKDFHLAIAKPDDNSDTRQISICAKNRLGLFSKIAGVFTLNNLDILDAQVHTLTNEIAVDIFTVKSPLDQIFEHEIWDKVKQNLKSALLNELDLTNELGKRKLLYEKKKHVGFAKPDKVVVNNDNSGFFTIIEVFTYDYPGLLFHITDVLFKFELDICFAKIATKVDQVVDVFYVRDSEGQKLESEETIKEIIIKIENILPGKMFV